MRPDGQHVIVRFDEVRAYFWTRAKRWSDEYPDAHLFENAEQDEAVAQRHRLVKDGTPCAVIRDYGLLSEETIVSDTDSYTGN